MATQIIDDHSNVVIPAEQAAETLACIVLNRNGQEHSLIWRDLNLTDESWDKLIKTLREFCPNVAPVGSEHQADECPECHVHEGERHEDWCSATDEPKTDELPLQPVRSPAWQAAVDATPANIKASAAKAAAPAAVNGSAKRQDSKQVRAWWYALKAAELKALNLPTPKDRNVFAGKMPVAVYAAYDAQAS